jgi:hypothetical protein
MRVARRLVDPDPRLPQHQQLTLQDLGLAEMIL